MWAVDVLDALTGLGGVEHVALRLIYWRGMTQRQVADELQLPDHVVRQCVSRGMRLLGAQFSAVGPPSIAADPPGDGRLR